VVPLEETVPPLKVSFVPLRLRSDAELGQLDGYPREVAAEDLTAFFRLDADTRQWLVDSDRGAANRLGLSVQLCTLPWLVFVLVGPGCGRTGPAARLSSARP